MTHCSSVDLNIPTDLLFQPPLSTHLGFQNARHLHAVYSISGLFIYYTISAMETRFEHISLIIVYHNCY